MKREEWQTVCLAAAVVTGRKLNKNEYENSDWEYIYGFACCHGISGLISYALNDFDNIPQNVLDAFENDQNWALYKEVRHSELIKNLLEAFEKNQLFAMPLKGYWIKKLYPLPELRRMGDIDILIKSDEYTAVAEMLQSGGYEFEWESRHEYIYRHPAGLKVELHKTIVPPYNSDLYNYYGDGLRFAVKADGFEYIHKMYGKDLYVYMVAHAAKHYLNGGFGIRQICDIYVLKNKLCFSAEDMNYINTQLMEMGLNIFHSNLTAVEEKWFEEIEPDTDVSEMEEYIFKSGIYGSERHWRASAVYRNAKGHNYFPVKVKNVMRLLFPSRMSLEKLYPKLRENKLFYPWYIIKRLFCAVFIKKKYSAVADRLISDEEVDKYAEHWKKVGIKKTL